MSSSNECNSSCFCCFFAFPMRLNFHLKCIHKKTREKCEWLLLILNILSKPYNVCLFRSSNTHGNERKRKFIRHTIKSTQIHFQIIKRNICVECRAVQSANCNFVPELLLLFMKIHMSRYIDSFSDTRTLFNNELNKY